MTRRGRLGIASVGQEFYASLRQVNSDGCLGEQPLGPRQVLTPAE